MIIQNILVKSELVNTEVSGYQIDGGVVAAIIIALLLFASFAFRGPKGPKSDLQSSDSSGATKHLLTPEDIVAVKFMATKFQEGYERDQVDALLDQATRELQRIQDEHVSLKLSAADPDHVTSLSEPIITPEGLVNARFKPTKFREGYSQDQVDDFIDHIVVTLRYWAQENEELKAS